MRVSSRLLAALLLCGATLSAQIPRPSVQVDALAGPAGAAALAIGADAGLVAILYVDGDTNALFLSTSDGAGLSWSPSVRVDDDTGFANKFLREGSVQVLGDHVFCAWLDERDGLDDKLYTSWSLDRGATFAPNVRVDDSFPASSNPVRDYELCVAPGTPNDNVYFLLAVDDGDEELYLVANDQSAGVGVFLAPVYVPTFAPQSADVDQIALAAFGDTCFASWNDNRSGQNDTWWNVAPDRGQTWSAASELRVDTDPAWPLSDSQDDVALAVQPPLVAVAFLQENSGAGADSLRVAVSSDLGASFGTDVQVGDYVDTVDDVDRLALAFDASGFVVVTWVDDRAGPNGVYVTRSTDGGLSFEPDRTLATDGNFPRLAADPAGPLGVTFTANAAGLDVARTAFSLDGGATWPLLLVSDNPADVDFAEAAFLPPYANFVVAWLANDAGFNHAYAGGFSVAGPATSTFRNQGANAASLSVTSPVVLGGTFGASVDLTTTGHALAFLVGFASAASIPVPGGQFVLVNPLDPAGELFGGLSAPGPLATFSVAVPNDPSLLGFSLVATQAVHLGGVMPFALSNAQDLVPGAF